MGFDIILWLLIGLGIPALIAWLFTFSPQKIVRWEGRFYRGWYEETLHMSDAQLDNVLMWPKSFRRSLSQFVNRAEEHPQEFGRLITFYRALGCFVWAVLILAASLLIWGAVTGRLMIVR